VKRLLKLLAFCLVVLAGALVFRAVRVGGPPEPPAPVAVPEVDASAIAGRLAAAIAVPTISFDERGPSAESLAQLRAQLAESFPATFERLPREELAGGTLILTWQGSDSTLAPIVLMAHQDVVPVPTETEAEWTQPPFAGILAGGYVWGRGALDDKGSLISVLSAAEGLLERGFAPARTIVFVFGHDEEVGGQGALAAAERLAARGVRPALVLDEGLSITHGMVPGVERPVALLGIAEKGYATFEVVATGAGGHSSMPPRETAIGLVAGAVTRMTRAPLAARPGGPAYAMFDALAPATPFLTRLVLANRWLFGPLLERQISAQPSGDALLRTTVAPTVISGGVKENVLPPSARALVNCRIAPGDTVAGVEEELRRRIADPRVTLRAVGGLTSEPSPVSDPNGWAFSVVSRSVREIEPQAVVAPGLMIGATDSRRFAGVSDGVLRFQPVLLGAEDIERFHGKDERVSIENLERAVRIYTRVIVNAAG